ncbi:hypothetical protein ID866_12390 [Astraeus odoratus]|nr:hypothetical protein ID866_12390 [Astraeus odoratus]
MDNWKEFMIELQTTFGPHNLVTDAEHELDYLQMKENQHINNNKLGKDGKLTAAEHKRHFNLNLCMFCGGNGHFLDKCPKKEAKAKAHAATAAESSLAAQSDSGPAPESKN